MSECRFAGVDLPYVRTVGFRVDPQYSPDGMRHAYDKVTVTVNFMIANGLPILLGGETPANCAKRLERVFSSPRQAFFLKLVNDEVIDIPTPPDVANGPFPRGLEFFDLTAE